MQTVVTIGHLSHQIENNSEILEGQTVKSLRKETVIIHMHILPMTGTF